MASPAEQAIGSTSEDSDRSAVKSLNKALALMEAIATADVPPRVAELALRVGVSRPSAYRIIQTLVAAGYVTQDPQSARLAIGYSVLTLSASLLDNNRLRLAALPHLQSLAKLTGERTNLGILHNNRVLYLAGVEKPSLPTIYSRFGKTAPAHCCSLGKAILAHLPEREVEAVLAGEPLRAQTPNSITDPQRFKDELEVTRQRGFATDRREHVETLCCLAAPIFDSQNRAVGAIGVSGSDIEPLMQHVDVVKHLAELLSQRP